MQAVGFVVIGRNEGLRLQRCLESVLREARHVVYVDSGSSDDSVARARALGVDVIDLDLRLPFTAARARNAGYRRLLELVPSLAFIHFIDGDCELVPGWVAAATTHMAASPQTAVVCGRLRERFPEASPYNRLCDMEWDGPVGDILACGGIALYRVEPLQSAQGFREDLIAGEEPELCVRIRQSGRWRVVRLAHDMALHDAAMTRFGQWFRRTMRSGFAAAQGAALHGALPERHGVRQTRRALVWGLGLPLVGLAAGLLLGPPGWLLFAAYPAQWLRTALRERRPLGDRLLRASFLLLGKFPEALGVLKFRREQRLGRRSALIEYK
ncbi:MAG: glycosyltransferase family A protein [Gammaproteobacteria bacterium]